MLRKHTIYVIVQSFGSVIVTKHIPIIPTVLLIFQLLIIEALFTLGIFALAGGFMGIVGWSVFPYYAILSRTLIAGAIFEFAGVLVLILSPVGCSEKKNPV